MTTPANRLVGVNHAWSNRSSAPCLLIGTMTDAIPVE